MRDFLRAKSLGAVVICLLLANAAFAQDLFVRNKPYKGEKKGRAPEIVVRLDEVAKALDMPAAKAETGWTLNGVSVPTTEEGGTVYIKLSDLTLAGAQVTHNKDFNTIDVNRPVASGAAAAGGDATEGSWVMVHWTAPW